MDIKRVGVVGCGLMGHGITQVAAQAGYDVVVREVSQEKLDSGLGKISGQLKRAVDKGRMEQSAADEVTGRIKELEVEVLRLTRELDQANKNLTLVQKGMENFDTILTAVTPATALTPSLISGSRL